MKFRYIFLAVLMVGVFACNKQKTEDITVMAYYVPNKNVPASELPLDQLTHIIFSFTHVIDGEMKFHSPEVAGAMLNDLVEQRKKHPQLKVMIACGGWGAGGFSDMASTPEGRLKFAKSVAEFLDAYDLDGLDMDWEYPCIPAAGTNARPEDKENFTALMKLLREHMDELDREQTLTFASAGWSRYYDNIEVLEVMKYANYMNVMTYDQIIFSTPHTGHHTPLGNMTLDDLKNTPALELMEEKNAELEKFGHKFEPRSVERIVDYCIGLGVNPKQIVIGAAFYGRSWKGVDPENNGLYQRNKGSHIGWCAYEIIRNEYESKNGYKRFWDSIAKAPYLYNATDSVFFSYDDTMSVKLKTQYAIDNELGGIMFWELSNDTKDENSLLDAIDEIASKN